MDGDGLDRDSLVTPPSTDNRPSVQQDERVNYHPYRPSPSQARLHLFTAHTHTHTFSRCLHGVSSSIKVLVIPSVNKAPRAGLEHEGVPALSI